MRGINNEAARRCRTKQKQSMADTRQEIVELENRQRILKDKEAELVKMRDKLKALCHEVIYKKAKQNDTQMKEHRECCLNFFFTHNKNELCDATFSL